MAGSYRVLVSNAFGAVPSSTVGLRIPALLAYAPGQTAVTLSWDSGYFLQSADNVLGPYADVPAAVSPYVVATGTAPERCFRLRAPTAGRLLLAVPGPGGIPAVQGTGLPGYDYVVEASTNLVDWTVLATNAAPFNFLDAGAAQYSQRFYRSRFLP